VTSLQAGLAGLFEQSGELLAQHFAARRQNSSGSSAASGDSGTMRSTMPAFSKSTDRTPWLSAISAARSVVRCTIALAPSGGSGESQPCWAASTRSAGSSASAPPPVP